MLGIQITNGLLAFTTVEQMEQWIRILGRFRSASTMYTALFRQYVTIKIFACLQDLPESLAKLKKLERLDLGDNEIDHLPPHIGELCSLEGMKEGAYSTKYSQAVWP